LRFSFACSAAALDGAWAFRIACFAKEDATCGLAAGSGVGFGLGFDFGFDFSSCSGSCFGFVFG
jgi:hypothetical protein